MQVQEFATEQKTSYCIDLDTRDRQVKENCQRIKGRIQAHPDNGEHIAVVCYGPSLEDTWEQLKDFPYIITCSGAHKFLIDRGIVPTYHCEVDPRPHKADLIGTPHKDVQYLIASVAHKAVFDLLEGYNVKLWHVFSHEAGRDKVPIAYPRGEWSLTGGSNVGLRSMVLARFLGFKRMTLFGMDYSFKNDGSQHAGWHPKEIPNVYAVPVGDKFYYTNPPMHQYAQSFFKEVNKLGDIEVEVRGEGLLQAQIREHCKTQPLITNKEPSMIAATSPAIASQEYLEQNKRLHETTPEYGISGSKRAEIVKKLIATTKAATVLDYGCGKGTLAESLAFPIWEYDPCIPGKDKPPRPADLVVCTDVLEHVEPDYLESVLLDLSRVTMKVCYAIIHTGPAGKTLPDGRNAHLIQQPLEWWKEELGKYFKVASIDEKGIEITAILGPKPRVTEAVAPPLDFSKRITPVRLGKTEARFYTPNEKTQWRAKSLITKEPNTIEWIDTFKKGDVLFDVGANVGGYTVWASQRRKVKVVAFEPEAGNYSMLCRNMELNGVDGVAYPIALSNETKLSELHLVEREIGSSCNTFGESVGFNLKPRKSIPQGAVGFTLDSLLDQLPAPDHIKIDVDGLEHKVIQGMKGLLESGKVKSLLIEINTNLQEHLDMIAYLETVGYKHDPAQLAKSLRKEGAFIGCGEVSFTKPNAVEDYVLDKIRNATIAPVPYQHLYIEDIFPEGFTVETPEEGYKSLEEARGTPRYAERFVHQAPESVDWMRSGKLRALLNEKFGVKASSDETCLLRDKPGYSISPHTDTPSKVVTALFYLKGNHGTTIYEPLIDGFKDTEGKHHKVDGFREVWTAPGKKNSVFIFARTDNSFHGCKLTDTDRDILLWDSRV